MYMAVIEHYNNVMAFADDKETAKKNAIKKAMAIHGTIIRSWKEASEDYGSYIVEIKDGATLDEEGIKCGWYDEVSYE